MKRKLKYLALALILSQSVFSYSEKDSKYKLTPQQELRRECLIQALKTVASDLKLEEIEDEILKSLKLQDKFTKEEKKAIRLLAADFDVPIEYIYRLFNIESRGNPQAVNFQKGDPKDPLERIKLGRATGLIQWMPFTAKRLGTTTEKLYSMTVIEQLEYVKLYLERINPSKRFDSFTDLYLAVLFPRAINEHDTYILGSHRSPQRVKTIAKQNPGIDRNKDGKIEKSEVHVFANC